MKVTQEIVTVWAEPDTETVNILLAGLHITLDADETVLLASALAKGLERLRGQPARDGGDSALLERIATKPAEPPSVIVRKDEGANPADVEAMQLRTRALVQASIRDKGLSLREEPRS